MDNKLNKVEDKIQTVKEFIVIGYPPTKYFFTDRWAEQPTGYYKANRNKGRLLAPIYRNIKGREIIDMTQAIKQRRRIEKGKR